MKKLLQEIKTQPQPVREAFMWLMVVITFSVVGFVWFRSTEKRLVAMLHPPVEEIRAVAEEPTPTSPFATLLLSVKDLKASLFELFDLRKNKDIEVDGSNQWLRETVLPGKLPLSGNK